MEDIASVGDHRDLKIGVLALQGDFREHEQMLHRIGIVPVEVRKPEHLYGLDGIIIPGGESTTIGKLAVNYGLMEPLKDFAAQGKPVWGTCAGMIFLSKDVGMEQPLLGLLDVKVRRNAFGRQLDSFEADIEMPEVSERPVHAVFIRAPIVESVGPGVQVLGKLQDGTIVAVRQGNILATSFHPELTQDPTMHLYFISMAKEDLVTNRS